VGIIVDERTAKFSCDRCAFAQRSSYEQDGEPKMADGGVQIVNTRNMAPMPKGHMDSTSNTMSEVIGTSIFDLFKDLNSVNEEKQSECIARLVKHFTEDSNGVRVSACALLWGFTFIVRIYIFDLTPDFAASVFYTRICYCYVNVRLFIYRIWGSVRQRMW